MVRVTRTVAVRSAPLPKRTSRILAELEGMYRNAVEQLTMYAARSGIKSFTMLKALKYRELRSLYPSSRRTAHIQRARTRRRGPSP